MECSRDVPAGYTVMCVVLVSVDRWRGGAVLHTSGTQPTNSWLMTTLPPHSLLRHNLPPRSRQWVSQRLIDTLAIVFIYEAACRIWQLANGWYRMRWSVRCWVVDELRIQRPIPESDRQNAWPLSLGCRPKLHGFLIIIPPTSPTSNFHFLTSKYARKTRTSPFYDVSRI